MRYLAIPILAMMWSASAMATAEVEPDAAPEPSAQSVQIQPPRFKPRSRAQEAEVSRCYSHFARRTGQMGRVVARVTIAPDGSVGAISLPAGVEEWQEQTARCVIQVLAFEPATRDGVAVSSEVGVPLVFTLDRAKEVTYLKVAATEEEMEGALRDCYPADALSIATPVFRVTVNARGRATEVTLVESSGDESMDAAGACVLKALTYEPTRQDDRPVVSTGTFPVTLRPPKQAASGAPKP